MHAVYFDMSDYIRQKDYIISIIVSFIEIFSFYQTDLQKPLLLLILIIFMLIKNLHQLIKLKTI